MEKLVQNGLRGGQERQNIIIIIIVIIMCLVERRINGREVNDQEIFYALSKNS